MSVFGGILHYDIWTFFILRAVPTQLIKMLLFLFGYDDKYPLENNKYLNTSALIVLDDPPSPHI